MDRNAPLRLKHAAELAFPLGGMTASGLRREIGRGNLSVEVIAGKQFVTLAGIDAMRDRCRTNPKERASGCAQPITSGPPPGLSEMAKSNAARDAALRIARGLSKPSPRTLLKSMHLHVRKETLAPYPLPTFLPSTPPTTGNPCLVQPHSVSDLPSSLVFGDHPDWQRSTLYPAEPTLTTVDQDKPPAASLKTSARQSVIIGSPDTVTERRWSSFPTNPPLVSAG